MKTVAIVEPDAVMSLLLREICRTSDYAVVGCERDGLSAIAMIEYSRPDLLLLEFRLGEACNGLELIERAKASCPSLYTIMLTAMDTSEVAGRGFGAQPDRILRKPISTQALREAMASADAGSPSAGAIVSADCRHV